LPGVLVPPSPAAGLVERALDLLFPPRCVGCGSIGRWICDRCWPAVPWLPERRCSLCGRHAPQTTCVTCSGGSSALDGVIAVADFEDVAREAVHAVKFDGRHAISRLLGQLMAARVVGEEPNVVIPVPLHPARRRERGYDQSVLLARHIARVLNVPCYDHALRRSRRTEQQATLESAARRRNVAGAFETRRPLTGASILLVDDVLTTGATLEAAAEVLRASGAESIIGLVFAHAR
jgi:ComF family protein